MKPEIQFTISTPISTTRKSASARSRPTDSTDTIAETTITVARMARRRVTPGSTDHSALATHQTSVTMSATGTARSAANPRTHKAPPTISANTERKAICRKASPSPVCGNGERGVNGDRVTKIRSRNAM